jgi:hypothetical protein
MLRRCYNPKDKDYKHYGARGIKVCKRWHKLENFIKDMNTRISKEYTLDRIEVDKNYEPKNVKWSTIKEQNHNRRIKYPERTSKVRVSFTNGITKNFLIKRREIEFCKSILRERRCNGIDCHDCPMITSVPCVNCRLGGISALNNILDWEVIE